MTRLVGLTSEPSQANSFVAAWLESLEDSHAQTSALPASKPESPESIAGSGSSTRGLFAKLNPDGSISKMSHQSCMWEMEEPYLENLPSWGSMRNGELCQRPAWVPHTSESEFSFLPTDADSWRTPCSRDHHPSLHNPNRADSQLQLAHQVEHWSTPDANESSYSNGLFGQNLREASLMWSTPTGSMTTGAGTQGRDGGENLQTQAANWPSPQSHDQAGGNPDRVRRKGAKHGCANLADDVTLWSTPNVPNGGRTLTPEDIQNRGRTAKGKRQVGLENEAGLWATPQARDEKNPDMIGSGNYQRKVEAGYTIDLGSQAANWPSPQSRDWKSGDASEATRESNSRPLKEAAERWQSDHSSHQDQLAKTGKVCWCGDSGCDLPSHKRRLNPLFATWLMGWPLWWCMKEPTPYAPSGMASWLSKARRYLENF